MNPALKYTLGRLGLFVACALVLLPVPANIWIKLMAAVLASFVLQFVLLRKWRLEMINQVDMTMTKRRQDKERLRAALAGDAPESGATEAGQDSR